MNRTEFMKELESLLKDISRTEREEALQYYEDYFDDAGAEKEQAVLEALGNPARVAETIKRDLTVNAAGSGGNSVRNPMIKYGDAPNPQGGREGIREPEDPASAQPGGDNTVTTVLWILAAIFLVPVGLGLSAALVSVLVGLIAGWFSFILGCALTALVLLACLASLLAAGVLCLPEMPMAGIALAGAGLICGGIGILFIMLTVALAGIVTPWGFRGLVAVWKWAVEKITDRKGAVA